MVSDLPGLPDPRHHRSFRGGWCDLRLEGHPVSPPNRFDPGESDWTVELVNQACGARLDGRDSYLIRPSPEPPSRPSETSGSRLFVGTCPPAAATSGKLSLGPNNLRSNQGGGIPLTEKGLIGSSLHRFVMVLDVDDEVHLPVSLPALINIPCITGSGGDTFINSLKGYCRPAV